MKRKNIEKVIAPPPHHWVGDGFKVHNFIPGTTLNNMERMNPFILLDYNANHHFPPSDKPRGVGVHPHRGFETVTIAYKGRIQHHDSSGGGGIIGEGDVQWMTAASGILHKEYHEKEWSKEGGQFQMVQLWVNLPARNKMEPPKYQAIKKEDFGRFTLDEKGSEVEVISGNYLTAYGPASTFTPVYLMNLRLKKGYKLPVNLPANYPTALLVIEGSVLVNEIEKATVDHFILMANDGENFTIEATNDALVLLLSGEPIDEPIAAHGPFVMNNRRELIQAFDDFNRGKFGFLED